MSSLKIIKYSQIDGVHDERPHHRDGESVSEIWHALILDPALVARLPYIERIGRQPAAHARYTAMDRIPFIPEHVVDVPIRRGTHRFAQNIVMHASKNQISECRHLSDSILYPGFHYLKRIGQDANHNARTTTRHARRHVFV